VHCVAPSSRGAFFQLSFCLIIGRVPIYFSFNMLFSPTFLVFSPIRIKEIFGSSNYILFIYRLPFTMLVLQKAVKMVWSLPKVMRVAYAFMLVMLLWMGLWSFGAAGVVASSMGDGQRWWLLVVSWQVLLFISSVVIMTRITRNYYWNECQLMTVIKFSFVYPGFICKLILDRCSPM